MIKYFLIALLVLSLVALVGCARQNVVMNDTKTYSITSDIHSLDVQINAAEFVIEQGDVFSVESNLKNLSVSEEDGVLKITEKTKFAASYSNAILKLSIPEGFVFENASIKTGAGKLTAESFSANEVSLKTGAGKVEFEHLEANENVSIKGGTGQIDILDGVLHELTLDLGVGELNMTAKLLGDSDLKFGVGESNITLIGSRNDYSFNIVSGIGAISIDDTSASTFVNSTNGENTIKIKGGVGATNIEFQQ